MPNDYNEIYDKLVQSDKDAVGLLAYGIYKREKRNHIIQHKKENNNIPPTDAEMREFKTFALASLERYKKEGKGVFLECVGAAVKEELERSQEYKEAFKSIATTANSKINDINGSIKKDIEDIIKERTFSGWATLGLNVAGTFLFSIILIILYVILLTSQRDIKQFVDSVVPHQIESVAPSDSVTYTEETVNK